MTRKINGFKFQERHRDAFEEAKEELAKRRQKK